MKAISIKQFRLVPAIALFAAGTLLCQPNFAQQSQAPDNRYNTRDEHQQMSGAMLENRVSNRLARSGSLRSSDIQVNAKGTTVTLTGTVPSDQAKQRAQRYAMQVPGVENVNNQLRINAQSGQQNARPNVDDSTLSKQIAQKLVRDVFPNAKADEDWLFGWEVDGTNFEFDVEVDDGDVTLDGSVPYSAKYSQILKAVRDVPGVRTVELELHPPTYGHGYYNNYYGYDYYPYYPYYRLWSMR